MREQGFFPARFCCIQDHSFMSYVFWVTGLGSGNFGGSITKIGLCDYETIMNFTCTLYVHVKYLGVLG